MSRWGKPTKNKRRTDPRYHLEETVEKDDKREILQEQPSGLRTMGNVDSSQFVGPTPGDLIDFAQPLAGPANMQTGEGMASQYLYNPIYDIVSSTPFAARQHALQRQAAAAAALDPTNVPPMPRNVRTHPPPAQAPNRWYSSNKLLNPRSTGQAIGSRLLRWGGPAVGYLPQGVMLAGQYQGMGAAEDEMHRLGLQSSFIQHGGYQRQIDANRDALAGMPTDTEEQRQARARQAGIVQQQQNALDARNAAIEDLAWTGASVGATGYGIGVGQGPLARGGQTIANRGYSTALGRVFSGGGNPAFRTGAQRALPWLGRAATRVALPLAAAQGFVDLGRAGYEAGAAYGAPWGDSSEAIGWTNPGQMAQETILHSTLGGEDILDRDPRDDNEALARIRAAETEAGLSTGDHIRNWRQHQSEYERDHGAMPEYEFVPDPETQRLVPTADSRRARHDAQRNVYARQHGFNDWEQAAESDTAMGRQIRRTRARASQMRGEDHDSGALTGDIGFDRAGELGSLNLDEGKSRKEQRLLMENQYSKMQRLAGIKKKKPRLNEDLLGLVLFAAANAAAIYAAVGRHNLAMGELGAGEPPLAKKWEETKREAEQSNAPLHDMLKGIEDMAESQSGQLTPQQYQQLAQAFGNDPVLIDMLDQFDREQLYPDEAKQLIDQMDRYVRSKIQELPDEGEEV